MNYSRRRNRPAHLIHRLAGTNFTRLTSVDVRGSLFLRGKAKRKQENNRNAKVTVNAHGRSVASPLLLPLPNKRIKHAHRIESNPVIECDRAVVCLSYCQ